MLERNMYNQCAVKATRMPICLMQKAAVSYVIYAKY